jgi:hypothetical protein
MRGMRGMRGMRNVKFEFVIIRVIRGKKINP